MPTRPDPAMLARHPDLAAVHLQLDKLAANIASAAAPTTQRAATARRAALLSAAAKLTRAARLLDRYGVHPDAAAGYRRDATTLRVLAGP